MGGNQILGASSSKEIECLVMSIVERLNRNIKILIVDFFPIQSLCSALDYYLQYNVKGNSITWFPSTLVENKNAKKNVVTVLDNIGFYKIWHQALNKTGYSILEIGTEWLEKYSLIDGDKFLMLYGKNGAIINDLCGLDTYKYRNFSSKIKEIVLPYHVSLHSFTLHKDID